MSTYGRAPPRSKRNELIRKGYKQFSPRPDSLGHFKTRKDAQNYATLLHKDGYLAQVVKLGGYDSGPSFVVMYKRGK